MENIASAREKELWLLSQMRSNEGRAPLGDIQINENRRDLHEDKIHSHCTDAFIKLGPRRLSQAGHLLAEYRQLRGSTSASAQSNSILRTHLSSRGREDEQAATI